MTAGGILILFRYRQNTLGSSLPFLQYFFILINVFGYYSLWSKILITGRLGIENAALVANVVSLLGTPFFLLGLVMLLIWACRVQQRSAPMILICVSAFSVLCALLIWLTGLPTHDPVRGIWSICALIFYFVVLAIIALGKTRSVMTGSELPLQVFVAGAAVIHASYFTPLALLPAYEIVFANLFFLFNAALVVFYIYRGPRSSSQDAVTGFDALVAKYGISKREADIIAGIYAGKTNQEIANQLFLSLQTVKDHCSRIYQKTFVKNRGQLVALMRESSAQEKGADAPIKGKR